MLWRGVTGDIQDYYRGFTEAWPGCYCGVSWVLQECYRGVKGVLYGCYRDITGVLIKSYSGVPAVSEMWLRGIADLVQGCYLVLQGFYWCVTSVRGCAYIISSPIGIREGGGSHGWNMTFDHIYWGWGEWSPWTEMLIFDGFVLFEKRTQNCLYWRKVGFMDWA